MDQQPFTFEENNAVWYKTGTGKPLLILHGWGSNSAIMTPLAKKLSDIRTCFLLDFPGFGNSPEPTEAWDVDKYTDFTEAFINREIKEDSIDILVHSYANRVLLKLLNRSVGKKIN